MVNVYSPLHFDCVVARPQSPFLCRVVWYPFANSVLCGISLCSHFVVSYLSTSSLWHAPDFFHWFDDLEAQWKLSRSYIVQSVNIRFLGRLSKRLTSTNCTYFASYWQLPYINKQLEENGHKNYFMTTYFLKDVAWPGSNNQLGSRITKISSLVSGNWLNC